MAYRALGSDYASNNQPSEANSNYTRAYELRERVTEPERLAIESNYYSEVTGQIDEAAQANRRWIDNYPQQVEAIGSLGIIYGMQGKYEEAAEAMRRIGRLQPDQIGRKENLSTFMMALATTLTKRPTSPKKRLRGDYIVHNNLYARAFLKGDTSGMSLQQVWFSEQPGFNTLVFQSPPTPKPMRAISARHGN